MTLHKFAGPNGFRRISHMQAMMKERIELTQKFGEYGGLDETRKKLGGSSFDNEEKDSPEVRESLRREVAQFIGEPAIQNSTDRVVVPYDGTEDARTIEAALPVHPPISDYRASLPA